jgi:hypothetical protein
LIKKIKWKGCVLKTATGAVDATEIDDAALCKEHIDSLLIYIAIEQAKI